MASDHSAHPSGEEILPGLYRHYEHYWSLPTYPWSRTTYASLLVSIEPNCLGRTQGPQKLLASRNCNGSEWAGDPWLHRLLERSERHLLHYAACSVAELRDFVAARRLGEGEGRGVTQRTRRATLEELLIDADDNPSFERFLDLPPELRSQIYDYYFADFKDREVNLWPYRSQHGHLLSGLSATQVLEARTADFPPLVTCNRQVRAETLPMFWFSHEVSVGLVAAERGYIPPGPDRIPHIAYWHYPTDKTFGIAQTSGMIGWIRHLHLIFEYTPSAAEPDVLSIHLDVQHGTFRAEQGGGDGSIEKGIVKRLRRLLNPVLRLMALGHATGHKLQLDDLSEITKVLERSECLLR